MAKKEIAVENGMFGYYQYFKDGSAQFVELGRAVALDKIICNEENNEYFYILCYEYQGKKKKLQLPRKDLNKGSLLEYAKHGLDVFEHNVREFLQLLQELDMNYLDSGKKISYHHEKLGWHNIECDGESHLVFKHYHNTIPVDSNYTGNLDIRPKGTINEWSDDISRLVIGNTPMETIVAIGLSSVLFGYLKDDLECENPIFHIVGDSSSGKTTAVQLAVSTAGNPDINNKSLLTQWGGTDNSILTSKMGNCGLCTGLDELSMFGDKKLTDLVYKLASGVEKIRLNEEFKVREGNTFKTVIISTGEASLLQKCSRNVGLRVRVIELKSKKWTIDAENAEQIKSAVKKHYGTAAVELARFIQTKNKQELLAVVSKYRKYYGTITKVKNHAQRLGIRYALVLSTAELASECFDFALDINKIATFFAENEEQMQDERDLGTSFYDMFKSHVFANKSHFIQEELKGTDMTSYEGGDTKTGYQEIWGKISKNNNETLMINDLKVLYEVTVRRNCFDNIVKELGFEDSKNILSNLRDKNLISCEAKRLYRRRQVDSNIQEKVYVFYFLEEPVS